MGSPPNFPSEGVAREAAGDISVGTLIGDGWQLVKEHTVETIGGLLLAVGVVYGMQAFIVMGIYMVMFVAMLVFAALQEVIGEDPAMVLMMVGGGFGYALLMSLIIVIQTIAMAAYQATLLKLVRKDARKIQYTRFIKAFSLPLAVAALLQVGAALLGSLALIIGTYVVMLGLFFTSFLVFDWGLPAKRAIVESWKLMRGYKAKLFVVMLALGCVNIVGLLTCGAGMLVTIPIAMAGLVLFYDRIARPGNVFFHV